MDGEGERLIRGHLEEIASSDEFRRAERQVEILRALVAVSLRGNEPTAREIATRVYGRGDDGSIHALKQSMHNLRRSLALYYSRLETPPAVRFDPGDRGYALRILRHPAPQTARRMTSRFIPGRRTAAVLIVLSLVVVTAVVIGGWWNRPRFPASVQVVEGWPILVDEDGVQVTSPSWEPFLKPRFVEEAWAYKPRGWDDERYLASILRVAVLERSEKQSPQVIVLHLPQHEPGLGRLYLVDGATGTELGSLALPYLPHAADVRELHYITDPPGPAVFQLFHMQPADLDGAGRLDELVVNLRIRGDQNPGFASQILALDFSEGIQVRRDYWTAGHVDLRLLRDFDSDGKVEFVLAGTNNDYQKAVVVVLSIDEPDGRTRTGDLHRYFEEIADLDENGIILRFPRTPVSESREYATFRPVVSKITYSASPPSFTVLVRDTYGGKLADRGEEGRLKFILPFDGGDVVASLDSYDFYLRELPLLWPERFPPGASSAEITKELDRYQRELASKVEIWDGGAQDRAWRKLTAERLANALGVLRSAQTIPE
jgi:hypothetical protein